MLSSLSLSGVPQVGLDMTSDLSSLLTGLVVLLTVSFLGILLASGADMARKAQVQHPTQGNFNALPKAA